MATVTRGMCANCRPALHTRDDHDLVGRTCREAGCPCGGWLPWLRARCSRVKCHHPRSFHMHGACQAAGCAARCQGWVE